MIESLGLPPGSYVVGMDFPTRLWNSHYLPEEVFALVLRAELAILIGQGYRYVFVASGHGAVNQQETIARLCIEFQNTTPARLDHDLAICREAVETGLAGHADIVETLLLMHYQPGSVDLATLPPREVPIRYQDYSVVDGAGFSTNYHPQHLVRYDPRDATAAKGRKWFEDCVQTDHTYRAVAGEIGPRASYPQVPKDSLYEERMMVRLSVQWASFLMAWLACANVLLAKDPVKFRPGRVIPSVGERQQNLIPNASFECGTYGWGSTERDVLPGWYGTLNGLFGRLDSTTAADGRVSLKIELTPENLPVAYNDYLHTQRWPITAPLAANVGWIAVRPGQKYTFSAALKAAQADTPARLVVRQFRAVPFDKLVRLTTDWQRYQLDFTPMAEACYVLAGPDLGQSKDNPHPPRRATVWLDAVQLCQPMPSQVSPPASRSNWG